MESYGPLELAQWQMMADHMKSKDNKLIVPLLFMDAKKLKWDGKGVWFLMVCLLSDHIVV